MNKTERNSIHTPRMVAAMLLVCAGVSLTGCTSQKQTDNAIAYRKIGIRAMENGQYAEAINSFQQALDQSKGQIRNLELDICMNKAEALYLNDQPEDAIAVCDSVLDYDENYADAYYLRGNIHLQQGDTKQALADYGQAAKYADAEYEIYIQMYENLSRAGMADAGMEYLNQALELKGNDRYHLSNRGYVYYLLGDYANAKEQLTKAVDLEDKKNKEGTDDKAQLYLAQTLDQLGDSEGAAKYYKLYAKDHADDAKVLAELGDMAFEKGDYDQALTYYQKGLDVNNPVNEQQLRRGEIAALEQLLEFEQAKEKMAQYVQDYPNDDEAARENLFLKTRGTATEETAEGTAEDQEEAESE